jgi:hypothetical protein
MKILKKIKHYLNLINNLNHITHQIEKIQLSLGRLELRQIQQIEIKNLHDAEFQVFSQWGEDGIIQYLISKVPIDNKIFVEFGVENYTESNTRFLLQNNNWQGLVIDSSEKNIEYIKKDSIYWKHNLKAICAFIAAENINDLLIRNGISGDIGLLSIDIDGNDYWIWKSIDCISPRIVICEYNNLFGAKLKITIPYNSNFNRTKAHFSNLYFGASIAALNDLAEKKGYSLIGSNKAGGNAFFVRNDILSELNTLKPENAFIKAQYRESRDIEGNLNYLNREQSLKLISEMVVLNIENNEYVKIKDIIDDLT